MGAAVSSIVAPHDAFFLPNFAFFWGSQLAVIALLYLAEPRAAAVGAISVVAATILIGFRSWIWHRANSNPDGLVWMIDPVLLFGAAMGGVAATFRYGGTRSVTGVRIACITGMAAAGASCLSAVLIFYCL